MRTISRTLPAALAISIGLAGCGGSGGGAPIAVQTTPPTPVPTTAPVSPTGTFVELSITFPARPVGTTGATRRPAYISPSIQSLSFSIDGAAPTYVNAPAATGSPLTVTTTLAVAPGSHAFSLAEYDGQNGSGSLLGRVMQTNTIVKGILNQLSYTLNGQLAKIAIQPPVTPFVEGTAAAGYTLVGCQPETFTAVPEDADGNTIVVPGLIPAVTASSAAGAIVATPLANNQFTLEAPAPATSVAITASGQDLDGKTVSSSINVGALAAFYVADFTVQRVRAFDENGTPLVLPAGTFPGLTNPMGLAASPCSSTAGGNLYVTETSNAVAPYVAEYDLNGNPISLASGAFPFSGGLYVETQPLFLTYAAGQLVVPNEYSSSVVAFDLAGTSVPFASGTFAGLSAPIAVAYDTHNGQYYVTSDGASTLNAYTSAGAAAGTVTTNSHPMGAVFDSNNNSLYVASGGTTGAVLDQVAPANANVAEYSEVPAAVTNTGGFTATSLTAFYTGITFDPYSKQLYVSDAGDSSIVAYTEAGASVTLATGAFSTINATTTPKADPMAILFVP